MASIINGVTTTLPSSSLNNSSATKKIAADPTTTNEKLETARVINTPPLRPAPDFATVFSADNYLPTSSNRALNEYVSIQNNEKREQVSQMLGLDIYV